MELSIAEFEPSGTDENRVKIVGTSLMNYGMPLIRYQLHDFTSRRSGPCPCGREHERIGPVETLVDDYIVGADGSLISPSLLYHPFVRGRGIISSQLVQEEVGKITVNLVVNELFTKDEESSLRKGLVSTVGSGTSFRMERVESIPLTANGKFRFVISKVSHHMSRGPNGGAQG
jgi:phenylacetate-CoA ligase